MVTKRLKDNNKKNVLYVLGSGGHTQEMIILSKSLKNSFNYFYIIQKDDVLSEDKIIYPGKVFYLLRPKMWHENWLVLLFRMPILFFKSFYLIKKNKIDYLISTGPGITVPLAYAAKILGKRIIFIECFSRVATQTITGRLVYPISDLFFVQWKENLKNYPKALYKGRLL